MVDESISKDRDARGSQRRRQGVGEEVGPRPLAQQIDDLFAAGCVSAGSAAEGLAQGRGDDVDAALHPAVLGSAAAGLADVAGGVGVIDHHHGVVAIGEIADLVELDQVAVHGEDAVGGDQAPSVALGLLQDLLEFFHVRVGVAKPSRPCTDERRR